jgi:predicted RNA methylase
VALLPDDVSTFTFVDYGAGKGRCCFLASAKNFRKIVGVEFARELCADMERNIKRFKAPWQRCSNFEVICLDATRYDIPDGDCVLFMFNPSGATR